MAMAVLDLRIYEFTNLIGLGAKDFNVVGNEIDPKDDDDDGVVPKSRRQGILYAGRHRDVYARQRQDVSGDGQRRRLPRRQCRPFSGQQLRCRRATGSLARLQSGLVRRQPVATGARSFSIRATSGELVYDSGSILDREATSG